ncbi:MAG: hypothetical protein JWP75_432 [Frondihabitans sp.]|nr:hypothetical protein [Frondihabitans sp.]
MRLNSGRDRDKVVGHADWYVGNTRFEGSRLVGTFDWDLVSAPEAQIAGFAAATFTDGGSGVQDLPQPVEVAAFLRDFSSSRWEPLTRDELAQSAAAASWALAYNARCQLSFLQGSPDPGSALDLVRKHGDDYLNLRC